MDFVIFANRGGLILNLCSQQKPQGGWWEFGPHTRDKRLHEPEQLERLGELSEVERTALHQQALGTKEICRPFRRRWSWWKFIAPERRDYGTPEAVQLIKLGNKFLTRVERNAIADPTPTTAKILSHNTRLSEAEREFLNLPPVPSHIGSA